MQETTQTPAKPDVSKVKNKNLGVREKSEIVKLIDSRKASLTEYIGELAGMSDEVVDVIPFTQQKDLDKQQRELEKKKTELEELETIAEARVKDLVAVLKDEAFHRKERIEKLYEKIDERLKLATEAIEIEEDKKSSKKKEKLREKVHTLKLNVRDLERLAQVEQITAKAQLKQGYAKLKDQVNDTRNTAVEEIWTGDDSGNSAKEALNMLPSAVQLREKMSPEVFTNRMFKLIAAIKPEDNKLSCKFCGASASSINCNDTSYGYTRTRCTKCDRWDCVDSKIEKLALPNLSDVLDHTTT